MYFAQGESQTNAEEKKSRKFFTFHLTHFDHLIFGCIGICSKHAHRTHKQPKVRKKGAHKKEDERSVEDLTPENAFTH